MRLHLGLLAGVVLAAGGTILAKSSYQSINTPAPRTPANPLSVPVIAINPTTLPATPPTRSPIGRVLFLSTEGPATTNASTQEEAAPLPPGETGQLGKVVVTSDLDVARAQIAPALGAAQYSIGPTQILTTPGGENAPFQQVLLRAPGVVQDSFGQQHVRGEHANLTYRVNGVLLPEAINTFGQELDTRLIDTVTLIDGSLPAQFGFRTAGIVDVTTKSGESLQGTEVSVYGGSYNTIQPSITAGGTAGKWDYFITGSYKHSSLGIDNPTDSMRPIHDDTDQTRVFTYLSYHIDDTSRVSLLLNGSHANFQIPNTKDLPQQFALAGHPNFNSADLDENQNEQNYYGVLSYQKSIENISYQVSAFSRYGQIHFTPDPVGDLIFQAVAGDVYNSFFTNGVQADASLIANDKHTVRFGLIGYYTSEVLHTSTNVFPTDPVTGNQASDVPIIIDDDSSNRAFSGGLYIQDEWRITPKFTLNYGLRYDRFSANFADVGQLSPRVNMVYKPDPKTTLHAGYSRFFVPPPVQNGQQSSINKFANTTNAPENFTDTAPKVERSHYFDVGVSEQVTPEWTIGVDGFYKDAHNLVDEGQFGAPVIEAPFNYRLGHVYGAELSTTYSHDGWSTFGNFSWVEAKGKDINSQQFLIGNDELDYIHRHFIHLDHEGQFTGSAGIAYSWKDNTVYVDALYGSGLRGGFANTAKLEQYAPVNVGYQHIFRLDPSGRQQLKLRVDVVNVFDEVYELRDGSGIGVGAAQFGQRRGFYAGVAYDF